MRFLAVLASLVFAGPVFAGPVFAGLVLASPAVHAGEVARYLLDERVGTIAFVTHGFGIIPMHGEFGRFQGALVIDPADLAHTAISLTVDDRVVRTPMEWQADKLRSADFLDSARFPVVTFRSTDVVPESARRFQLRGVLTVRGVARQMVLDVSLTPAPDAGPGALDVAATGPLHRSEFGMVADRGWISDIITLTIRTRIAPPAARTARE